MASTTVTGAPNGSLCRSDRFQRYSPGVACSSGLAGCASNDWWRRDSVCRAWRDVGRGHARTCVGRAPVVRYFASKTGLRLFHGLPDEGGPGADAAPSRRRGQIRSRSSSLAFWTSCRLAPGCHRPHWCCSWPLRSGWALFWKASRGTAPACLCQLVTTACSACKGARTALALHRVRWRGDVECGAVLAEDTRPDRASVVETQRVGGAGAGNVEFRAVRIADHGHLLAR